MSLKASHHKEHHESLNSAHLYDLKLNKVASTSSNNRSNKKTNHLIRILERVKDGKQAYLIEPVSQRRLDSPFKLEIAKIIASCSPNPLLLVAEFDASGIIDDFTSGYHQLHTEDLYMIDRNARFLNHTKLTQELSDKFGLTETEQISLQARIPVQCKKKWRFCTNISLKHLTQSRAGSASQSS